MPWAPSATYSLAARKSARPFSITEEHAQMSLQNEFDMGNALRIDEAAIVSNMNTVQRRNKLPLTTAIQGRSFCVEVETGTGKTYVYTKTIFELNQRQRALSLFHLRLKKAIQ